MIYNSGDTICVCDIIQHDPITIQFECAQIGPIQYSLCTHKVVLYDIQHTNCILGARSCCSKTTLNTQTTSEHHDNSEHREYNLCTHKVVLYDIQHTHCILGAQKISWCSEVVWVFRVVLVFSSHIVFLVLRRYPRYQKISKISGAQKLFGCLELFWCSELSWS